jgi:O-antigen ligase
VATVSRTGIIMFAVIAVVFASLRPREAKRLWPAIPVLLVVIHLLVPGVMGTIKDQFFPKGGLVAQQERGKGTDGQGRVADLASAGQEFHRRPLFGEGYGTRVTGEPGFPDNAQILDDQWLKTLLETGVLGVVAWAWLLIRFVRQTSRAARRDQSSRGLYLTALSSAAAAFGVAMITYDELSFIQVTFVFFIMLGIGTALMEVPAAEAAREFGEAPAPARKGLRVATRQPAGAVAATRSGG